LGSDPAGLTPSLALDEVNRASNTTVVMGSDPQGQTPHQPLVVDRENKSEKFSLGKLHSMCNTRSAGHTEGL
jgi:hypothetical protein